MLALVAASVLVFASDLGPVAPRHGAITGPYAYLLASSTDLGPSRDADAQLTLALHRRDRPAAVFDWADRHDLAIRWHPGDNWAVVKGPAQNLARAFDV